MKMNYCYLCGAHAETKAGHGTERHWQCTGCGQTFYSNPKPATEAVLVTEDNRVAVAVRSRDPHKGKLDLPGGFVDAEETIEDALARELQEEIGLDPSQYGPMNYLYSAVDHYPWGPETHSVTSMAFTARIDSSTRLIAQDDVAAVELRDFMDLKVDDFAWPSQYDIVKTALDYWKSHK